MAKWKLTVRAQPTYSDGLVRFDMTLDDKSFTLRLADVDGLVQSIDSAIKGEEDVSSGDFACLRINGQFVIVKDRQKAIESIFSLDEVCRLRDGLVEIQKGVTPEISG